MISLFGSSAHASLVKVRNAEGAKAFVSDSSKHKFLSNNYNCLQ